MNSSSFPFPEVEPCSTNASTTGPRHVFAGGRAAIAILGLAVSALGYAKQDPVEVIVSGPVEVQGSVEVVNDALKTPFNRSVTGHILGSADSALLTFPFSGIPAGKRLVVEFITVAAFVFPGETANARLELYPGPWYWLTMQPQGLSTQGEATFVATHALTLRINPATQELRVFVSRHKQSLYSAPVAASIAGYLEDI